MRKRERVINPILLTSNIKIKIKNKFNYGNAAVLL